MRKFALVLSWYWLIGSCLLLLRLFPMGLITVTSNGDFLASIPENLLRVLVIPFLLAQVWQLRVLKRHDIIELFVRPAKPAMGELKAQINERA